MKKGERWGSNKPCQQCGEEFYVIPARKKTAKFCSYSCRGQYRHENPQHAPEELLWSKMDIRGTDDCWPWKACCIRHGYGILTVHGKRWLAHRLAYTLTHGEFDSQLHVRHKCDNPPCCNPAHLELGTAYDNAQDRVKRGRSNMSSEAREKLSRAHKGKVISEEAKEKMRAAKIGKPSPNRAPVVYNGKRYPSMAHLSDSIGVSRDVVYRMVRDGEVEKCQM